jgi:hypothetical protein
MWCSVCELNIIVLQFVHVCKYSLACFELGGLFTNIHVEGVQIRNAVPTHLIGTDQQYQLHAVCDLCLQIFGGALLMSMVL